MTEKLTKPAVREELSEVLDPCSCFTDDPVNILDLGLLERIEIDDGHVHVELLLTSQMCTYFLHMSEDIHNRVSTLPGVESVEVSQVTDKIWRPERMATAERRERREKFRARMEAAGIVPYAEQEG